MGTKQRIVITGLGVVSPIGIGKDAFWQGLAESKNGIDTISSFETDKFSVHVAGEVKNFDPKAYLGQKGLRNLDRSALFLMTAAKSALEDAQLQITEASADDIGICTGTNFSHLWSIVEFDKEVFKDGLDFANPALFPSTVMNAASSHVSIRFNIKGFNTTISTGYTSGLASLKYAIDALNTDKAKIALSGGVDVLTSSLFFGFHKLGYMAGLKGLPLSCPFDKRHNGPVLGEAAAVFCIEEKERAAERKTRSLAEIKSVSTYFDAFQMSKIQPQGEGLEKVIKTVINEAGINAKDIDYISSCANSSVDFDRIEAKVLKNIFGKELNKIPVSSIKSMVGETFSAASSLQIASCIGAMKNGFVPATINLKDKDPECDIDCVPNKAQKKNIKLALITSFGPGGYNSACILENINN